MKFLASLLMLVVLAVNLVSEVRGQGKGFSVFDF